MKTPMKTLFGAVAAALMMAAPTAALANNTFEAHQQLWNNVPRIGVKTYINNKALCSQGVDGAYFSGLRTLHICQDNGRPGGPQVSWTDNDLDTLRHEVQHIIQDCAAGSLGDDVHSPMFDYDALKGFLRTSSLSQEQLNYIIRDYSMKGVSDSDIVIELEAWAVAADVDASSINKKLLQYCGR
jgi:hypothetical protein